MIGQQIFIDDEWHGFYYALNKSPGYLLTHFAIPGATCIPLNFYSWLLGATIGWSEILLRLPSLVFGLLLLFAAPILGRRIAGDASGLLFTALIAISPILIFYSRNFRPYEEVAVSCFVMLMAADRWNTTRNRLWAALFVLSASAAVWFHLYATVVVAAPLFTGLVYSARRWLKERSSDNSAKSASGVSFMEWLASGFAIVLLVGMAVGPALLESAKSGTLGTAGAGTIRLRAFLHAAMLIVGTGEPLLAAAIWLFAAAGAWQLSRRMPWLASTCILLYPLEITVLLLSKPDSLTSGIVIARYCIALVPITLLFAARGIDWAVGTFVARLSFPSWFHIGICAVVPVGLLAMGPLLETYAGTNSFTNHGAFQDRYSPINWKFSFINETISSNLQARISVYSAEVPAFYLALGEHPGDRPIIEYPMLAGNAVNHLYFYQYLHQRRVIAGYILDMRRDFGLIEGAVYGNAYIDQVLSKVPDKSRLHFRNLVCMDDLEAVRATGADYVVMHKLWEAALPALAPAPAELTRLIPTYVREFGRPIYEDKNIIVFSLHTTAKP
jgi:hypothetical protein